MCERQSIDAKGSYAIFASSGCPDITGSTRSGRKQIRILLMPKTYNHTFKSKVERRPICKQVLLKTLRDVGRGCRGAT